MITTELTKKELLIESLNELDFSNEPQFSQELRDNAKIALENLEFPTSKTEYWKYTRIGKIINKNYGIQNEVSENAVDISNYLIPEMDANVVVLVNGFCRADLSQVIPQKGINIHALNAAIKKEDDFIKSHLGAIAKSEKEIFIALNTLCFTDGVYIDLEKGTVTEKPIHIINVITNDSIITNSRTIVKAHDNSSVKIVESFVNLQGEQSFTNNVSEFFLNPNAQVEYTKIQNKGGESYHVSTEQVYQRRSSNFTINTITLDGTLVRNNLNIDVDAEGCETNLNGIYLGKNKNHIDNHTIVDHLKPNCNSNEVYKGLLDDNSVGVFNGKVFVRPDAQKTNAFQQNNNILLTDGAVINSKPELEIYADDVKCSHGSTIGQLNEEAIFYLQARGVSQKSAINMMITAFAKDALERVSIDALKTYIESKIEYRFGS
ncbi:MAG: Fe-S cluster assembly protein SufD [Flavobacteriales bacterium]|tara:strand:- start:112 stop:1410 length:1299 start_codon:yes stop_codon:yes gene_type:complete